MNNEAFRKLLNSSSATDKSSKESSQSKSTKEVAREAVEQEFRERRGKRGRDDDYLSGDDDDDDENDWRSRKRKAKQEDELQSQEEEKAKENEDDKKKKLKYRDRARERREGKHNVDYQDSKDMANVDAEMTKYLGGDIAYTHLVKGLDRTLAEKVRREEIENRNGTRSGTQLKDDEVGQEVDLDQIMEAASASLAKARKAKEVISSTSNSISNIKVQNSTSLTTGMLSYLQNINEKNEASSSTQRANVFNSGVSFRRSSHAGRSIALSTLSFSTSANVHDRLRSWELPRETIMSKAQYERMYENIHALRSTCTPLDQSLILKLKTVFSRTSKKKISSTKREKKSNGGVQNNTNTIVTSAKSEVQDDSDDDIFGDIGEYVPPTKIQPIE